MRQSEDTPSLEPSSQETTLATLQAPLMANSNNNSNSDHNEEGTGVKDGESSILTRPSNEQDENEQQQQHQPDSSYFEFLRAFCRTKGGWQVLLIGHLLAMSFACTVGIVPLVTSQRYAKLNYFHHNNETSTWDVLCSDYLAKDKPPECVKGGDDAQTAAAISTFAGHILLLFCNSIAGSYSDLHGRRVVHIFAVILLCISPSALIWMEWDPNTNPLWFYIADAISGAISFLSVGFTILSDIMPSHHRAASFGLYLGLFYGGIALGPRVEHLVVGNHNRLHIIIFAFVLRLAALLFAIVALPETLPPEQIERRRSQEAEATAGAANEGRDCVKRIVSKIARDASILIRTKTLVVVTIATFLCKMVFSVDLNLFFYYIENKLNVGEDDIAIMLLLVGICGVLVQAVFLKLFVSLLGERLLLIVSFIFGTIHNLLYGLARGKVVIYIALCISQLSNMYSPLLLSVASQNVRDTEQGQIQGTLYALSGLAEAIGPIVLNYVYAHWSIFGPGTMFICASFLMALGAVAVTMIPRTQPPRTFTPTVQEDGNDDEQPILRNENDKNNINGAVLA